MKPGIFLTVVAIAALASCKSTYKATNRPKPTMDSTSSTTDSMSSSTNKMSTTADPATMPSKTDSSMTPKKDPATMPPKTDSSMTPKTDPATMPSKTDSPSTSNLKPSSTSVSVPEGTQTAFTKQYPNAANVVWSHYDSLAAVPIDLRMAGWKKMDDGDLMAKFDLDNENYYAWYDSDGHWVGSAYNMQDLTKLPAAVNAAVKNAVKTKYAGYKITNVNRELQKDKKAYEVELKKDNSKVKMMVNADGKITQVFKYVK